MIHSFRYRTVIIYSAIDNQEKIDQMQEGKTTKLFPRNFVQCRRKGNLGY